MARRKKPQESGDWLFPKADTPAKLKSQSSLLDVVDNVLNRGAVLNGDVVLGVANVDLIYVKLSVLLAALDKVTKRDPVFKPVAAGHEKRKTRRNALNARAVDFRYRLCTALCMTEYKNTPDNPNSDPRDREPADEAPATPPTSRSPCRCRIRPSANRRRRTQ